MDSPSSSSRSAVSGEATGMTGDFISVGDALKLVPTFKGDKHEVLAFVGNVDTAVVYGPLWPICVDGR